MENEKKKKLAKIFGTIAAVLVVISLVFALLSEGFKSCSKEKTFNDVVVEDYNNAVQFADTNKMFFYEVQTHMAEFVDECKGVPAIDSVRTVYQVNYTVEVDSMGREHKMPVVYFLNRAGSYKVVPDTTIVPNDFWTGTHAMIPEVEVVITYEEAVKALKEADVLPHTQFMTLRWPLNMGFMISNPVYIFGHQVYVDAVTGEVIQFGELNE